MNDTAPAAAASPRWRYYTLLLALFAAIAIYLPGINGSFIHDDTGQITANDDVQMHELTLASLERSITHYPSRPLPMMSFALNHLQCGLEPSCYKSTNIFIHAANGLLLFVFLAVVRRIGQQRRLYELPVWTPVVVTALWLLHPLNVSTVLYVVQRMTELATLFSLLALTFYLLARHSATTTAQKTVYGLGAALALLAGLACKENAILVLPLIGLLELLLLTPEQRARIPHPVATGWGIAVLLFSALALLALYPPPRIAASYLQRDFLPGERLLTEARILWYYAGEILWPDPDRMTFFLDIFPLSHGLFTPWTTFFAVAGWLCACGIAIAALLRGPSLWAFGTLFFLVGHVLESTVLGIALTYEHRNYMPGMGLLLAAVLIAQHLLRHRALRIAVAGIAVLACAFLLIVRVLTWSADDAFYHHLQQPQFAASYTGTVEVGAYYDRLAGQQADNPLLSRLYANQALETYRHAATLSTQPYAALSFLLLHAGTPTEQEAVWQQMFTVAASQPVTFDALNHANIIASCLLLPECPLSRNDFAHYLDLLLANPRNPGSIKRKFQRTAGTFFTKVQGETEKGLALSRTAAASGDPDARESLIKNLAYAGRTDEARREYAAFAATTPLDSERRQRIESALTQPGVALPGGG